MVLYTCSLSLVLLYLMFTAFGLIIITFINSKIKDLLEISCDNIHVGRKIALKLHL